MLTRVPVHAGREVIVPAAAKGVAKFKFGDLCSRPLGAADYLAISRAFHTGIVRIRAKSTAFYLGVLK